MDDEKAYRYDFRELDRFLFEEHGPEVFGEQLEQLMDDLVYACKQGSDFAGELDDHYLTLSRLRDLFRRMRPKTAVR